MQGICRELEYDFQVEQLIESNDPVFAGHYPHLAIYPGALLVERMRRAVLRHGATSGVKLALTKIQRVNFHYPVFPGTKIALICKTLSSVDQTLCLSLQVTASRLIATAKMDFEVVPAG